MHNYEVAAARKNHWTNPIHMHCMHRLSIAVSQQYSQIKQMTNFITSTIAISQFKEVATLLTCYKIFIVEWVNGQWIDECEQHFLIPHLTLHMLFSWIIMKWTPIAILMSTSSSNQSFNQDLCARFPALQVGQVLGMLPFPMFSPPSPFCLVVMGICYKYSLCRDLR